MYLGEDHIDDDILRHVMRDAADLYFPQDALVPAGGLIVDVGAHHGIYAVEALRRYPGTELIAVEPNPEARAYFRMNLQANGWLDRVRYVEGGLARKPGVANLRRAKASWDCSTVMPFDSEPPVDTIPVPVMSITEILGGRLPSLMKINAEGAEFEVVPDLVEHGILPEWLILFMHPDRGEIDDILTLLTSVGYKISGGDGRTDTPRVHCHLS